MRLLRLAGLSLAPAAAGCVSTAHPTEVAASPTFDPITFFAGRTQGTGVLRIALHRPRHALVDGIGHVEGAGTIILDQTVRLGGKAPTDRRWRLTRTAPDHYGGTLSDATGPVTGEVSGDRLHLAFRMKGGLSAQQWLVLQPGGRSARNVMLVTKIGVPVARLDETIVRE